MKTRSISVRAPWGTNLPVIIGTDRNGDIDVVNEVIRGDTYKVGAMTIEPALILDIGAHIGTFTMLAAERWPNARIFSLEPNARNFELLTLNTERYENVTPLNYGISYANGDLFIDGLTATGGGFITTPESYDENIREKEGADGFIYSLLGTCPTATIRQVVLWHDFFSPIDLVKWDCEGGEVDAFRNMEEDERALFDDALMVGEYHIDGGYRAFEALANERFENHTIIGRREQMDNPVSIGWFQMTPNPERP